MIDLVALAAACNSNVLAYLACVYGGTFLIGFGLAGLILGVAWLADRRRRESTR